MENRQISEFIRNSRLDRDITQYQLSQKAGVSVKTIQRIELGDQKPTRRITKKIFDALKISSEERFKFGFGKQTVLRRIRNGSEVFHHLAPEAYNDSDFFYDIDLDTSRSRSIVYIFLQKIGELRQSGIDIHEEEKFERFEEFDTMLHHMGNESILLYAAHGTIPEDRDSSKNNYIYLMFTDKPDKTDQIMEIPDITITHYNLVQENPVNFGFEQGAFQISMDSQKPVIISLASDIQKVHSLTKSILDRKQSQGQVSIDSSEGQKALKIKSRGSGFRLHFPGTGILRCSYNEMVEINKMLEEYSSE